MWPRSGSWDSSPRMERVSALLIVAGAVLLIAAFIVYFTSETPVANSCEVVPGLICTATAYAHYWSLDGLALLFSGVGGILVGVVSRWRLYIGRRQRRAGVVHPPA
jgi:hypothetical protein